MRTHTCAHTHAHKHTPPTPPRPLPSRHSPAFGAPSRFPQAAFHRSPSPRPRTACSCPTCPVLGGAASIELPGWNNGRAVAATRTVIYLKQSLPDRLTIACLPGTGRFLHFLSFKLKRPPRPDRLSFRRRTPLPPATHTVRRERGSQASPLRQEEAKLNNLAGQSIGGTRSERRRVVKAPPRLRSSLVYNSA